MSLLRSLVPTGLLPENYLAQLVVGKSQGCVFQGPFKGMRYAPSAIGSTYLPKLLGTYEKELYPLVEQAIQLGFDLVVDIGAAEGYYAIGLATRLPKAKVVAFEMEQAGRDLIITMAALNGVQANLDIKGTCEVTDLAEVLKGATKGLVICDVEGYELELLDPTRVPALAKMHILVELHAFVHRDIEQIIERRFSPSHTLKHVNTEPRTSAEFPFNDWYTTILPKKHLTLPLAENRPEAMAWFWMEPK